MQNATSKQAGDLVMGCVVVLVLVVFLLTCVVRPIVYRAAGTTEVTIKVVKLEQVNKERGKYLVFAEGEVFEITDTVTFGRWDSSDLYGRMAAGKTYTVRVAGWRVPLLSWYRNIISAEEVPARG